MTDSPLFVSVTMEKEGEDANENANNNNSSKGCGDARCLGAEGWAIPEARMLTRQCAPGGSPTGDHMLQQEQIDTALREASKVNGRLMFFYRPPVAISGAKGLLGGVLAKGKKRQQDSKRARLELDSKYQVSV